MDIFHRPPAISEDTLQYTLYPPPALADKASVTSFAACIDSFVQSMIPGFIWHRDPFELKVVPDSDSDRWMLEGRMRVGDCVDDEWCVVWLLKEVSKRWDVVIRCAELVFWSNLSKSIICVTVYLTQMANSSSSRQRKYCLRG